MTAGGARGGFLQHLCRTLYFRCHPCFAVHRGVEIAGGLEIPPSLSLGRKVRLNPASRLCATVVDSWVAASWCVPG
jgi:hypothetical protein